MYKLMCLIKLNVAFQAVPTIALSKWILKLTQIQVFQPKRESDNYHVGVGDMEYSYITTISQYSYCSVNQINKRFKITTPSKIF